MHAEFKHQDASARDVFRTLLLITQVFASHASKTLPKEDLTLQKAISYDDNLESGGYIVVDETDNLNLIKGKVIGKKPLYDNLTKDLDIDDEYIKVN